MTESEIIETLRNRLSEQIRQCDDMRTMVRILELLSDEPVPQGHVVAQADVGVAKPAHKNGYAQATEPSIVEEPEAPYGWHSDLLTPAQLWEVKRRYEEHLAGKGEYYSWEELEERLSDIL